MTEELVTNTINIYFYFFARTSLCKSTILPWYISSLIDQKISLYDFAAILGPYNRC